MVVVVVVVVAAVEGAVVLCDENIGGPEEAVQTTDQRRLYRIISQDKPIILRNKCIYINYHLGYC